MSKWLLIGNQAAEERKIERTKAPRIALEIPPPMGCFCGVGSETYLT